MKQEKVYYSFNLVDTESLSELDFVLYDEVLGDIDFDMSWPEAINKNNSHVEATPVKIDTLIQLLQSFKEKGANYVAIESDCDHHGYDISAVDIHASSEEEINAYLKKVENDALRRKQKDIEKLQKEIDRLKAEIPAPPQSRILVEGKEPPKP